MSNTFFSELSTTYNIHLSDQQKSAVLHKEGPCLLLAVPGGGKTTTLLSRTAYLIGGCGVPAKRILSITFSRASAKDMKARFEGIFRQTMPGQPTFSTIHGFAYGVVMSYMASTGRQRTLIEGQQNPRFAKGRILRDIYQQVNRDYISDGDYETLTGELSYVKNTMMPEGTLKNYPSDIGGFHKIYERYEAYKDKHQLMDFDDMLTLCYQIFIQEEGIKAYYQNRYDHIQVDEAQDTSRLQHEIIALLGERHKNIFYVADDDQSIYGFRGASPGYLLGLRTTYQAATIIRMEQNYRSTGAIVDVANRFIKANKKRYDKEIYTDNEEGLPVLIHEVTTRQEQYGAVMKALEQIDHYGEAAILYRNNHSAVSMVQALSQSAIPFKLRGLRRKFFDHWVVRDVLNILAFAQSTEDLHSFKTFYYKLRGYYISKQMIEEIDGHHKGGSVFDRMMADCILPPYRQNNVRNMAEDFQVLASLPVREAMEFLLTQMGYLEFLMDMAGGRTATFEGYNRLVDVVKDMATGVMDLAGLKDAIARMEARIKAAADNTDPAALTLSTVHSAKGLEWAHVHMIDLISGIFPSKEALESTSQEAMEEERRLFYVAMTRAKKDLVLYKASGHLISNFVDEVERLLNPNQKKTPAKQGAVNHGKHKVHYGSPTAIEKYRPMKAGEKVIHKVYGEGQVKFCTQDKITLIFPEGEKVLNYGFCMTQGLISPKI